MSYKIKKGKNGKCPYCQTKMKKDKSTGNIIGKCKHLKACYPIPEKEDKYVWRFEYTPKALPKHYAATLETMRAKQEQRIVPKAPSVDPVYETEKASMSDMQAMADAFVRQGFQRGRKSAHYFATEGIEEYLKPKHKRKLTLLKKQLAVLKSTPGADKEAKKILKGTIRNLSNRIKAAKANKKATDKEVKKLHKKPTRSMLRLAKTWS